MRNYATRRIEIEHSMRRYRARSLQYSAIVLLYLWHSYWQVEDPRKRPLGQFKGQRTLICMSGSTQSHPPRGTFEPASRARQRDAFIIPNALLGSADIMNDGCVETFQALLIVMRDIYMKKISSSSFTRSPRERRVDSGTPETYLYTSNEIVNAYTRAGKRRRMVCPILFRSTRQVADPVRDSGLSNPIPNPGH